MKTLSDIDLSPSLRVGSVISPHELPDVGIHLDSTKPGLDGLGLILSLPRAFIEPFTSEGLVSSRIAVYTTIDGRENLAIISIHRTGSLLHCVLPLSSLRVQRLLEDCFARNSIQFVMAFDGEENFGFLTLAYQFKDIELLRALMQTARPISDSDAGFLELEDLTTKLTADFKGALTPADEFRAQVVAVLSDVQLDPLGQQLESDGEQPENWTMNTLLH